MALFSKLSSGKNDSAKRRGKLIVIDGSDGSGKSTQIELLSQTLAANGYEGVVFDFPQYSATSAVLIEKYLRGEYGDLDPRAASVLYAIDRFDASNKIREYLDAGKIVLADRYVAANAGHQGAKIADYAERIAYYKWLDNLEYSVFNIPKPDLNIILHMPAEIAWELIEERSKAKNQSRDIHENDPAYLKAAEQVYLEIAKLFPNSKQVECTENGNVLTPKQVHAKVWELVRRIALKDYQLIH